MLEAVETRKAQCNATRASTKLGRSKDPALTSIKKMEKKSYVVCIVMLLLTEYSENAITFPCVVQEKLDGVRCLIRNGKGISRSGKEIGNIAHILDELKECPYQLDGELWAENTPLHTITGILNQKRSDPRAQRLKLYVFDVKALGKFSARMELLQNIQQSHTFLNVKFVDNFVCESRDQATNLANTWIKRGAEGAVFRNLGGLYIHGRSKDVQKYKNRYDDEYSVVGHTESEMGVKLLKCVTNKGFTFKVRCPATVGNDCKLVTIRYLCRDPLTDIPREAVCLGAR